MDKKLLTAALFHNLRILKSITPQDTYLEHYKIHIANSGDEFFDLYSLSWEFGSKNNPKKIMEIGVRTGLSICQLLSSCFDFEDKRVVLFDRFDDGLCCPDLVRKHLKHLGIPTDFLEFYIGDSAETVPKFKETNEDKFDWVLVDGAHDPVCCKIDLDNVKDMVAKGGLIVFDDIASTVKKYGFNLRPAWNDFKEENYDNFIWHEDHIGKGTAWGIKR